MNEFLYPMIFKRKSFHLFKETGEITQEELDSIREAFYACRTLFPEIKVEMKLVPAAQTTCKRRIMPADKVVYYNRIDIGIFLLFLELCLDQEGRSFRRTLLPDTGDEEKTLVAVYRI